MTRGEAVKAQSSAACRLLFPLLLEGIIPAKQRRRGMAARDHGRIEEIDSSFRKDHSMRQHALTTPQVAFIAGTRGALGFGVGLLLAEKLNASRRRRLGWSLLTLGLATTIPAARTLFGKRR